MPGIVLYMSKHGSTRQYAEWIGERTGFEIVDLKKENDPDMEDKETIVIGSWILAGRMVAHKWIKKNWSRIKRKKVIVFSVGGDQPTEELKKKYMDSSLPEEAMDKVYSHCFQGRFRQEDQNFLLRGMLKFAAKFEKEGDLASDMVEGVDGVRKENLRELLDEIMLDN